MSIEQVKKILQRERERDGDRVATFMGVPVTGLDREDLIGLVSWINRDAEQRITDARHRWEVLGRLREETPDRSIKAPDLGYAHESYLPPWK